MQHRPPPRPGPPRRRRPSRATLPPSPLRPLARAAQSDILSCNLKLRKKPSFHRTNKYFPIFLSFYCLFIPIFAQIMSSSAYHRQETPLATMQRPPTPSASHALAINLLARAQFMCISHATAHPCRQLPKVDDAVGVAKTSQRKLIIECRRHREGSISGRRSQADKKEPESEAA